MKGQHGNGKEHKFCEKILDQTFLIKNYDFDIPKGSLVQKFRIDLPDWLPASLAVSPTPYAEFKVEYRLRATFKELSGKGSSELSISKVFKFERPLNEVPEENLSVNFQNKVGGFLGLGTTQCDAKIVFNQNHFFKDAVVVADLQVNNSKCTADVDFYHISLI